MEEDPTASRVHYYPNPLGPSLTVDLSEYPSRDVSLTLLDLMGREVYSAERTLEERQRTLELDLRSLKIQQGIYVMRIASPGLPVQQYKLFKE